MNIERLTKLADFLDTYEGPFNFCYFRKECGCALSLTDIVFPDLIEEFESDYFTKDAPRRNKLNALDYADCAKYLFDINYRTARYLFSPYSDCCPDTWNGFLDRAATAKDVAAHIRGFLKDGVPASFA